MVSAVVPLRAIVSENVIVQLFGTVPVNTPSTQAETQPLVQVEKVVDVTVKRAKVPSWVTSSSTCTVPILVPSVLHSAPVPVPEQQQLDSVVSMLTKALAVILPSDTSTHITHGSSQHGAQQQHPSNVFCVASKGLPPDTIQIFPVPSSQIATNQSLYEVGQANVDVDSQVDSVSALRLQTLTDIVFFLKAPDE